jgi:hypothetical protein
MSQRSTASAFLLGLLLALPMAVATEPAPDATPGGPCVSLGSPPDRMPDVATGSCGPRILLHVHTPPGDVDVLLDVGPCRSTDCTVVVNVDVVLCSDWLDRHVGRPVSPVDGEWPFVDEVLDEVERTLPHHVGDRVVDMETGAGCDPTEEPDVRKLGGL